VILIPVAFIGLHERLETVEDPQNVNIVRRRGWPRATRTGTDRPLGVVGILVAQQKEPGSAHPVDQGSQGKKAVAAQDMADSVDDEGQQPIDEIRDDSPEGLSKTNIVMPMAMKR
jgi:hypothetical protein